MRALEDDLGKRGLGYRLRYLSGGVPAAQRLVEGRVIPERSGYYLGYRMVEAAVAERGIAQALRINTDECLRIDRQSRGVQTA